LCGADELYGAVGRTVANAVVSVHSMVGVVMNLDLREIQEAKSRVRRILPQEALSQTGGQYCVAKPVGVDLLVHKDGAKFRVVGRVDTALDLTCSRCLEAFPVPVGVDVDLLYLPFSQNVGDGEFRVEESDLNASYYRDDQIDLGQLVLEQFQLMLPMKPLCRDACRGLCAVCGGNRNIELCDCVETWEDPRLAVLKKLQH